MTDRIITVSLPVALRAIERARALAIPIDIAVLGDDETHLATLRIPKPDITLTVECLRATTTSDDETIDSWLLTDMPDFPRHGIQIGPEGCTFEHFREDPGIIHVAEII